MGNLLVSILRSFSCSIRSCIMAPTETTLLWYLKFWVSIYSKSWKGMITKVFRCHLLGEFLSRFWLGLIICIGSARSFTQIWSRKMLLSPSTTRLSVKSSKTDKYRKLVRNIKPRRNSFWIPTTKCLFQTLENNLVKSAHCLAESTLMVWPNSRRKNLRGKWRRKSKRMMRLIRTKTSSLEVKPSERTQAKMTKTRHLWTSEPRPPWSNSFKWTKMRKIFSGSDPGVTLFQTWFSRKMMINMTPRIPKTWGQDFRVAKL